MRTSFTGDVFSYVPAEPLRPSSRASNSDGYSHVPLYEVKVDGQSEDNHDSYKPAEIDNEEAEEEEALEWTEDARLWTQDFRVDSTSPMNGGFFLDVTGDKFNAIMGFVIVTNAVLLSIETDCHFNGHRLDWQCPISPEYYAPAENIYTLIFVVELVMRMWQLGGKWWNDSWNLFDFALVSFSVINLIVAFFQGVDGHESSSKASMVRLCRLLRVLRILRLFRMFHDLLLILRAFERAIKVVMWLGLLILLLDWMFAIALTQGVGHNAHLWAEIGKEDAIHKWFGNIRCSMQSLFIIMTLAEWDDMAYTLIEVLPPIPVFIGFMVYILICSYTMVSLITGIISESLVSAQQADTINKMKAIEAERTKFAEELKDIMIELDEDNNGFIEHEEVEHALAQYPGIFTRLAALDINIDLKGVLAIVDRLSDGPKGVHIPLLVEFMTNLTGHAKASSIVDLKYDVKATMQDYHDQVQHFISELNSHVESMSTGRSFRTVNIEVEPSHEARPEGILSQQLQENKMVLDKLCASFNVRDQRINNSLTQMEGQLARIEDTELKLVATLRCVDNMQSKEGHDVQSSHLRSFNSIGIQPQRSGDALLQLASIKTQLEGYLSLQLQDAKMTVDRLCASVSMRDERLADSLRQVEALLAESLREVEGNSKLIGKLSANLAEEVRSPLLADYHDQDRRYNAGLSEPITIASGSAPETHKPPIENYFAPSHR